MADKRKDFFKERTPAQIKKLNQIQVKDISELVSVLVSCSPGDFVQVTNPIFPDKMSARSFNKYGPLTRLRNFSSAGECLEARLHPWELLRNAVNSMTEPTLGYAIIPPKIISSSQVPGVDLRPLVVAWKEVFEGARVYAYSVQNEVPIQLQVYGSNPAYEGYMIKGSVPSRSVKKDRHDIMIKHVPAIALRNGLGKQIHESQFYIPLTIRPVEDTQKRKYAELRSGLNGLIKEEILPVMWADVALYLKYIQYDTENVRKTQEKNNSVGAYFPPSIELSPFPMVTRFSVDFYKKLRNNTLNHKGLKLRDCETNLALGELARVYKHGRVFFSSKEKDGRIADYDWKVH